MLISRKPYSITLAPHPHLNRVSSTLLTDDTNGFEHCDVYCCRFLMAIARDSWNEHNNHIRKSTIDIVWLMC